MDTSRNKPKTKVHKPGISRNFAVLANGSQEKTRHCVFTRRDSTPELGINSLSGSSFRRQKRSLEPEFKEVPSYNLWKSRLDRRSSLPNCLAFNQQKKNTISSGVFVPSVITRETKGLRKYSTSLGDTTDENLGKRTGEKTVDDGRLGDVVDNVFHVLPLEDSFEQIFSRKPSGASGSSRSYCDSVSTIRCTSTDIPEVAENDKSRLSYYGKHDSIKRWLSEVE